MPRGVSRAIYTGNGQAVEFPFLFKVWEEDQLSVLVTSPEGVTSEATGWSAELDDGGGTLTYLHNGAPLPPGWKLAIVRDMPFVQEVDLITGTRFDPEVVETALDVATAERQQLLERLARAVVVEPTDEAGPEALLATIRDARSSAAASATGAQGSANAAAESARAAAGSCAVATEAREAASLCAGEAKDARDVAIAQTEAANTLMEAELAKVNAIVAANKTDQQAAVTAARQWAEQEADVPVDYDGEGNPRYSARHWAENAQKIAIEPPTAERRGAIRVGAGLRLRPGSNGETDMLAVDPDGITTKVDAEGRLTALGGNLAFNSEEWITVSGTWVAPVAGWYDIWMIGGGNSGSYNLWGTTQGEAVGGPSGKYTHGLVYLQEGQEVAVSIGAGAAPGVAGATGAAELAGGASAFGSLLVENTRSFRCLGERSQADDATKMRLFACGGGLGGGGCLPATVAASWYGGGGGAFVRRYASEYAAGRGGNGAIRLRWHDPARAGGPQPAPALLAARRMAVRSAAPASVCLYDPESGQGSVWRSEDAEAGLARGMLTEAAWLGLCAQRAAEERAAWLADPATEEERFGLLRAARDAELAATDYLMAPDYPLAGAERDALLVYREALRDLPAQAGAPWDGGGAATPWPDAPACVAPAPAGEVTSCA